MSFPYSICLLRGVPLRNRNANGLDLGVLLEDFVAHLATPTGLFVSAERQCGVENVVAIDPNGAGAQKARDLMGFLDVASPYPRRQTINGIVGLRGDFLHTAEGNY